MKDLQPIEKERFELLKKVVSDSMMVCLVAGQALREIKEREFWKSEGFESFEVFVNHYWGWTKRYANQLILDADTINKLPENARKLLTSGAAIRELGRIPETLRLEVVNAATNGGKKTANATAIKRATPKSTPPPRPSKKSGGPPPRKKTEAKNVASVPALPKDATGCDIPEGIQELWNKGGDVKELMFYANAIQSYVEKRQSGVIQDPLFATFDFTDTIAKVKQLKENIREAIPYAVCATCGGHTPKDCQACKGRGFVSEFFWNNCVPEDIKALRTPAK